MNIKKTALKLFFGSDDKDFFTYHNKLISEINSKTVKYLSLLAFLFCAFLSLVYMIPNQMNMSLFYLISAGICGALTLISYSLVNKNYCFIHPIFWVFEICSLANFVYTSILTNTDNYSVVFFGFMVLLPMIYITKPWISLLENLIGYIVYLIFAILFKSKEILSYDLIYALLFYQVSNIVILYVRYIHVSALQSSILFKKEAQIDKLTNSYNKSAIELYAKEVLVQNKSPLALIVIDIDDFKLVNDRWGHSQGDIFLSHVSSILDKIFQNFGIIGRIGGDEFVILVENVYDKDLVTKRINLAIDNISKAFLDYSSEKITCSCGVSYKEQNQVIDYSTLFEQADRALYLAKQKGKNQCVIYKPEENNPFFKNIVAVGFDNNQKTLISDFTSLNFNLRFEDEINSKYVDENSISAVLINTNNLDKNKNLRDKYKSLNNKCALIVVSYNEIDRTKCLNNGADGFISFPCNNQMVIDEINESISKRSN